jgi:hypothetical protein
MPMSSSWSIGFTSLLAVLLFLQLLLWTGEGITRACSPFRQGGSSCLLARCLSRRGQHQGCHVSCGRQQVCDSLPGRRCPAFQQC